MLRGVAKFFGWGSGIALVGAILLFGVDYLRYWKSPEYQAIKEIEKIKKEYAEDPYGGDTPEETLRLFVDALKKGDTDLAAKYFVLDKQEEWKKDLAQIKDKNLLGEMVRDLEREKEKKVVSDTKNIFYIYNNDNVLALAIEIIHGPSKKWKIQDL